MKIIDCICGSKPSVFHEHRETGDIYYAACSSDFECLATTPDMPSKSDAARVWNAMQEAARKEETK